MPWYFGQQYLQPSNQLDSEQLHLYLHALPWEGMRTGPGRQSQGIVQCARLDVQRMPGN